MRELTSDLFISLDGFASGVDQAPYFGCDGHEIGSWVRDHLGQPQLIIMGRVTYVALAQFSASVTDELSVRMSALPKLVFSRTLKEPLAWKNTRLLNGAVGDEIRVLKQQRGDPLRSIGSISLVKSMMRLGLVDRLRLMIFPLSLAELVGSPSMLAIHKRASNLSIRQFWTRGSSISNTVLCPGQPVSAYVGRLATES
jgi:dihydrofolate reductase